MGGVRGNGNYKKRVHNYYKQKQAIIVRDCKGEGKELCAFVCLKLHYLIWVLSREKN
jgi:hypothetical protein